jgi:hypothetical protein
MVFLEQFTHGKVRGRAESRNADFAAFEIRDAGNRWIGHHIERHRIGHRAHRDEIAAGKVGVNDDLAIRCRDVHVARELRLSHRRGAWNIDQAGIEAFFFEKSGVVHHPKRRVERAHRRPADGQFLRMQRRSQK